MTFCQKLTIISTKVNSWLFDTGEHEVVMTVFEKLSITRCVSVIIRPIVLLLHAAAQVDKTVIDTRCSEDTGVRFCQQLHRLLQQHSCWCQWSTATEAAISPECSCTRLVTGARRADRMTPILHQLHWLLVRQGQRDGRAGIQMSAWHGSAIPVDILRANVITRRSASPALCWVRPTHCSTYEDKLRRPQFCGLRTSRVEQSSSRTPSAGHFTPGVQETTENVPVLG